MTKKKKIMDIFQKFMEIFTKLEVSISFVEALDPMLMYAKFMKELTKKKKQQPLDDENVVLTEESN